MLQKISNLFLSACLIHCIAFPILLSILPFINLQDDLGWLEHVFMIPFFVFSLVAYLKAGTKSEFKVDSKTFQFIFYYLSAFVGYVAHIHEIVIIASIATSIIIHLKHRQEPHCNCNH